MEKDNRTEHTRLAAWIYYQATNDNETRAKHNYADDSGKAIIPGVMACPTKETFSLGSMNHTSRDDHVSMLK